jgi:hypothetical protein
MVSVGFILVFFRLRRKHQAAFSSTRLMHDGPWIALQQSLSKDLKTTLRPGEPKLRHIAVSLDCDVPTDLAIEAAFSV